MANDLNIDKLQIEIEVNSNDSITEITKLSNTLKNLKSSTSGISSSATGLKSIATNSLTAVKGLGKMTSSLSKIAIKGTALIGTYKAISSIIGSLLAESSEYTEVLNKLQVSLGNTSQSAVEFAQSVSDLLGIDKSEWLDYQSTFGSMLKGFNVNSSDIQLMSQQLTQLAYDYSSLYNTPVQEAFNKLNSGLSGQIKGLKEYGNNISVTAVNEMLRKKGIDATISSLDAAGQAYARYIAIMENAKVTGVFNDMARTIDTTANRIRILQSQFTQLKRALGDLVNVIVSGFLPALNTLMAGLIKGIEFIGQLFGFDASSALNNDLTDVSNSTNDISNNVSDTSKKLSDSTKKAKEFKKQLQGFDEINIIPAPTENSSGSSGSKGSGTKAGNSIDWGALPQYNFLEGLENSINSGIEEWFKQLKVAIGGGAYTTGLFLGQSISDMFSNIDWTTIKQSASSAGTKFAQFLNGFLDGVNWKNMGNNVAQGFNTVLSFFSSSIQTFNFKKLGQSIAEYLSNAIGNIEWSKLGKTISNFFKGSLDTLITFVKTFDWYKVGKGIGDGLANIDYANLFVKTIQLMFEAIKGLLKGLSGVISGAIQNPLIVGFSAIASPSILNKIKPKVTSLINTVSSLFKPLGTMVDKVLTSSSWGDKLIDVYCRVGDTLSSTGLSTKIGDLSKAILGIGDASGTTTGILGKLGTVIGNLSLGSVIGTLGGIAAAIGAVWYAYELNQPNWENLSEEMQQVVIDAQNKAKAMEEATVSINSSLSEKLAEATILEQTINSLKDLGDGILEGGQLETAQMYVDQINKQMPNTVKITKDGRVEWQKTDDEIQKNIQSLKKKAVEDAKQKLYAEYIEQEYKARVKVNQAQENYDKEYQKAVEMWKKSKSALPLEEFLEYQGTLKDSKNALDEAKKAQEKVNDEFEESEKALDDVADEILGTSKTAKNNPINVKTSVDPITGEIKEVKSDGQKEADKSDIKYGTSVDDVTSKVSQAKNSGQTEANKSKINFNTDIIKQPMETLTKLGKDIQAGVQKGIGSITVNSAAESKTTSKKTGSTLKTNIQSGIGSAIKIAATITGDMKKAGQNAGTNFKNGFKSTAKMAMSIGSTLGAATQTIGSLKFCANGGLLSKGQLFVANEREPELVGNIGGQSFVANQNQVMDMMSNALGIGISQAMQSMMNTSTQSDRPIQITVPLVLDGKVVGQSFVEYHNGIVKQTGKSPLNT